MVKKNLSKIVIILTLLALICVAVLIIFKLTDKVTDQGTITIAVKRDSTSDQNQLAQEKCLDAYIKVFQKKNPGINVDIKYMNSLPSDTKGYDCILAGADDILAYIAKDLADISEYMSENSINKDEMLSSAMSLGQFGSSDAIYFMPFNYDRAVIYADTAVLDKAGVALPSVNWTYSEFEQMLEQLRFKDGKQRYCGVYMPYYMPYVWQYYCDMFGGGWQNGSELTMDSGASYDALMKMLDVYQDGLARSYKITQKGSDKAICAMSMTFACMPWKNGVTDAKSEDLRANPGTNTDVLSANGTLRLLPLPSGADGKYAGSVNTEFVKGFAVLSSSDKKENAAKFAVFAGSREGQRILNEYYGGIPTNKTLWKDDFWKKGLLKGENADAVLIGIESDTRDDFTAVLSGDSDIFYKNIRLRTIFSAFMIREFGASNASDKLFKKSLNDFMQHAKLTITSQVPSVS